MSVITGRRLNYFFQKISEKFIENKHIENGNFNDIKTTGFYIVSGKNSPKGNSLTEYGLLVVEAYKKEESEFYLTQIAFPATGTPYIRCGNHNEWWKWEHLYVGNRESIVDIIYPVGSIYMSVNSTNPATLFGGTWVSWGTGRVPVGVDTSQTEFNTVEKTGGSATTSYTPSGTVGKHTLTTSEIPSHKHSVSVSGGSHSHDVYIQHISGSGSKLTIGTSANNDDTVKGTPSGGSHTHTVSETSVGGGSGHNHTFTGTAASISALQPYITCYMWKRTA